MKRVIKAASSNGLPEKELLAIMDPIEQDIMKRCKDRGEGEYVDDVSWGHYGFKIPVKKNPYIDKPRYEAEVAAFNFHYDPDDTDYSAEEQAHVQYDEFLQAWDNDEEEVEYTSDDFIADAIEDAVYEAWQRNQEGKLQEADVVDFVESRLLNNDSLDEEDFERFDIEEVMKDYFWK